MCRPAESGAAPTAVGAESVDLEGVVSGKVVILPPDAPLQPVDLGREELDRSAAAGADHVMVAPAIVAMLEAGDAVGEIHFGGQTTLHQQFEGAIDGGNADGRIVLADTPVQLLDGQVLTRGQKNPKNRVALSRVFQSHASQVLVEDLCGFTEASSRDGTPIVDAPVKHERDRSQDTTAKRREHNRWAPQRPNPVAAEKSAPPAPRAQHRRERGPLNPNPFKDR